MRRLLRWAFNLSAVVSAALFVALSALWFRSYTCSEAVRCTLGNKVVACGTFEGSAGFVAKDYNSLPPQRGFAVERTRAEKCDGSGLTAFPHHAYWAGFAWAQSADMCLIVVPFWFLAPVSLSLPGLWLASRRGRRRRLRRQSGLCVSCGYDLRATPGRCPECGAVPAQPRQSST